MASVDLSMCHDEGEVLMLDPIVAAAFFEKVGNENGREVRDSDIQNIIYHKILEMSAVL